jgi:hypothetical protein
MPSPCRAHGVPLPSLTAKGLDLSFQFDLFSAALFDSHMPSRTHAASMPRPFRANAAPMPRPYCASVIPRPCRSESDFSSPQHSEKWTCHGTCELPSAVQRRHVDDLPAFVFFRLPRGVTRRLLSEAYQKHRIFPATTRTSTKDRTLSEHGRGTPWHMRINVGWHGRGRAWARHGMCELAFMQAAASKMRASSSSRVSTYLL